MDVLKVRISGRLAEERERLGKTQKEMAALGHVGDRSYWHYEKGERSPDTEFLAHIAEAGADVLYILTGQRTAGVLAADEAALLDNYRHTQEAGKEALRTTSAALAQCDFPERKAK